MTRSVTTAFNDEIIASNLRPALLIKAEFGSGDLNLWTGEGEIVYDGDTYTGARNILGIKEVKETQKLQANGMDFSLSGIDTSIISIALNEEYQWKPISMWFAVLDVDYQLIADPKKIFAGKMDVIGISDEGDTANVTVTAESNLIDLKDSRERRYTYEDQIDAFPGDVGLQFMPTNSDVEITWGKGA